MKLGIVGGGQLGRMLALAAHPLGIDVTVLDPAQDAPAAAVARHIRAAYDDERALRELAAWADVVTYEFESLPAAALARVAERAPLRPGVESLRATQDRIAERALLARCGVTIADHHVIHDAADLEAAADATSLFPGRLKTARGGYDGHGQRVVESRAQLADVWHELGDVPCLLEAHVSFARELSLVGVRAADATMRCWPVVENRHVDGVLASTLAPAPGLDDDLQRDAEAIFAAVASELDHVGVLAVELFDTPEGLVANEIAPRVHNSGHWTIEGACTSQFENHVRAVCELPLGSCELVSPAVMVNLLGELPRRAQLLDLPRTSLHDYGKQPRPGRKLGHVTQLVPDGDVTAAAAALAAAITPVPH
ncbi:MAG: 5-(carboxyamino)imidazole ribonucleotide synthase [Thermoleophilia bacterium]|nr:5-(carboxyamino)imidazole ribonucleotide synthase [Thermoleophilia bacterium]